MLEIFSRGLHDPSSGIRRAGKADLPYGGVDEQLFTDDASRTGDNVENPFRSARVLDRFVDQFTDADIS